MIAYRHALLATSVLSLAAAILIGQNGTTAASNNELPHNLAAKATDPPHVTVQRNPFIAFVVPHKEVTIAPGTPPTSRLGAVPGSVINAPADYVPNPSGVPATQTQQSQQVVLCDTWTTSSANTRDFTPTAVFVVGTVSLVAVAGDVVGGYRIREIKADSVGFDTGERLGFGDCRPPQTLDVNTPPQAQPQPATPQQFTRPQLPPAFPQVTPSQPRSPNGGQAPLPISGPQTQSTVYGGTSGSTYSNGIYGAAPPTSPPNSPFGLFTYPGAPSR